MKASSGRCKNEPAYYSGIVVVEGRPPLGRYWTRWCGFVNGCRAMVAAVVVEVAVAAAGELCQELASCEGYPPSSVGAFTSETMWVI